MLLKSGGHEGIVVSLDALSCLPTLLPSRVVRVVVQGCRLPISGNIALLFLLPPPELQCRQNSRLCMSCILVSQQIRLSLSVVLQKEGRYVLFIPELGHRSEQHFKVEHHSTGHRESSETRVCQSTRRWYRSRAISGFCVS